MYIYIYIYIYIHKVINESQIQKLILSWKRTDRLTRKTEEGEDDVTNDQLKYLPMLLPPLAILFHQNTSPSL
jgi:hypothetical protein